MFEIVKKMYIEGKLTDKGLDNAVTKGWITKAQKTEIKKAK